MPKTHFHEALGTLEVHSILHWCPPACTPDLFKKKLYVSGFRSKWEKMNLLAQFLQGWAISERKKKAVRKVTTKVKSFVGGDAGENDFLAIFFRPGGKNAGKTD